MNHFILKSEGGTYLMPERRRERKMRSNPTRNAIMNLFDDRPDTAAPTDAAEVHSALQADAPLKAVAYHLAVLAGKGFLKRDDAERFQPA